MAGENIPVGEDIEKGPYPTVALRLWLSRLRWRGLARKAPLPCAPHGSPHLLRICQPFPVTLTTPDGAKAIETDTGDLLPDEKAEEFLQIRQTR